MPRADGAITKESNRVVRIVKKTECIVYFTKLGKKPTPQSRFFLRVFLHKITNILEIFP